MAILILVVSFYYIPLQHLLLGSDSELKVPKVDSLSASEPLGSLLTKNEDIVEYYAKKVRLGAPTDSSSAEDLQIVIRLKGGSVTLTSKSGNFYESDEYIIFEGNVIILTSNRYYLRTDFLHSSSVEISGFVPGPVSISGPSGNIEAGEMKFDTSVDGSLRLHFFGGVKMVVNSKEM